MKKILFALVAIALVVVSCKPKTTTKDPFSIKMSVAGTPTATGADILCTPNYDSCYYMAFYAPTAQMSEVKAADVSASANNTIASAVAYGLDFAALVEYGVIMSGENTISYSKLDPETAYTALAIQVDEKATVYETLFTCEFTTAVMQQSSMTIAIAYADSVVNFTPSLTADSYGLFVEPKADFDKYYSTFDEDTWAQSLEDWAATYAQYSMTFPTYTGAQTYPMSNCATTTAIPAGTDFVAYAAPMVGSVVNGQASGIQFKSTIEIPAKSSSLPAKIRR